MSRVTEIRYVGYGVEDFDAECAFYTDDWGLVEVAADADTAWFKTHGADEHHVVRLHRSDTNRVEVIALSAGRRDDVEALHDRVVSAGCRVSDWLGDIMCFLRCNAAHHRLAILPGPPCLDHVAYDVLTIDDMMCGINRLKRAGTDLRWGPGRHTADNNTFSYFTTPNGFAVEYTSELEDVDFDTHRDQVHEPGPRTMDQWGIGVGGPQTMPHPKPDAGLWQAVEA